MKKKYKNTCISSTVYTLFLYLLVKTEEEIENTFFFLGPGIPSAIIDNVDNKVFIDDRIHKWNAIRRFVWKIKLLIKRKILWRFIDKTQIYGHDHLVFSPMLIRNNKITVIEDGLAQYNPEVDGTPHRNWLRKLIIRIYGRMTLEPKYGRSKYVDKVIMSGILPVLPEYKNKAEIVDVKKLWSKSPRNKKDLILKIFNVNPDELTIAQKKKVLLLTQPFNVIITEKELIEIYRDALKGYNQEDILIKTHPRDNIDYQSVFKQYHVLKSPIPMELLSLLGMDFEKAITISSTAIFSLPKETEKIILGHECHPTLLKELGTSTFLQKKS